MTTDRDDIRREDAEASPMLVECARTSRLLGGDPSLVLHGGGNSSAKDGSTIYVKASGHDMATIGPEGFAPLDRQALDVLLDRPALTDGEMVRGLRGALLVPDAPTPSIETLLHNLLPHTSVLHSHADAIVTLTNTRDGDALLARLLGPGVLVLPYCMPGFDLARMVGGEWAQRGSADVSGIVLAHHGLFTFADEAASAYRSHLAIVGRAADLVRDRTGVTFADDPAEVVVQEADDPQLAAFAEEVRGETGSQVVLRAVRSPAIDAFIARPDLGSVTQRGPATLEHVIRTKRVPLLGRDVRGFVEAYVAYVDRHRHRSATPLLMLDPVPRVVLDASLGLVTTGRTPREAAIAADIYRHTMRIITAAEALGGYVSIDESQAFDIEYWELEQAKLR